MALQVQDRVLEITTTTGTGDISLGGAYTGFRTFSSVCSVGDTCYYLIEAVDANGVPTGDWETGLGTYSATNTLTRTTVSASSNSNAAVSFAAGIKRVATSAVAASLSFRGALVKKAADQTAANYSSAGAVVAWDTELRDTNSIHDPVTNNSRLTVPSGVTLVRLKFNIVVGLLAAGSAGYIQLKKNGSVLADGGALVTFTGNAGGDGHVMASSAVLSVSATDFFEVLLITGTDTSVTVSAASWFEMEILG